MRATIGNETTILPHDNNPRGRGKIISFDVDMFFFIIEWISPEEKVGQRQEIAYCWLLDVTRY